MFFSNIKIILKSVRYIISTICTSTKHLPPLSLYIVIVKISKYSFQFHIMIYHNIILFSLFIRQLGYIIGNSPNRIFSTNYTEKIENGDTSGKVCVILVTRFSFHRRSFTTRRLNLSRVSPRFFLHSRRAEQDFVHAIV